MTIGNLIKEQRKIPIQVDEVQDRLAGSTVFSTLDLQSGYWQMPVNPADMDKTAFSPGAGFGLYQFCRMPFGLCNAPSSFQRMMDKIFRGLSFVSTYLDDILIHSPDEEQHKVHLQEVFNRLRRAGLTLRGHKCHIGLAKVTYLGHIFSANGMKPDPCKISVITKWPTPANAEEVRRFLGLASYYRRYINQFADIAAPLHKLTHKDEVFNWTHNCQQAFQSLKTKLTEPPVLAYPQFHTNAGEFVLITDASSQGVGAVLEQDGHVIAYASRALSKAEKQYSVIQQECLAIVYATKQFRHYLLGRSFKLLTDHAPLQWLSAQKMEGMLCRWALALQEFDFKISYRAGVHNSNADALSRVPLDTCAATVVHSQNFCQTLQSEQQQDPTIAILYQALKSKKRPVTKDPILRRYCQLWSQLQIIKDVVCRQYSPEPSSGIVIVPILPPKLRPQALKETHDTPAAGHFGKSKTMSKLRQEAYWVNMGKDVDQYCNRCVKCQQSKPPMPPRAELQNVPIGRPWQMLAVDILEVPISTCNNRYLLVIQDYFTKWVEAIPLPNQSADLITSEIIKLFSVFGIPDILHSDQGRNFESALFRQTLAAFGVSKSRTTAYHPQGDGMVERFNRSLLQLLRTYVEKPHDWEKYLPLVLYAYRTAPHSSTNVSPFMLMYGRQPTSTPLSSQDTGFEPGSYQAHLQSKLAELQDLVESNIVKSAECQKKYYDNNSSVQTFKNGDLVWLSIPTARKLDPRWEGGWVVKESKSPVTMKIENNSKSQTRVVHINRLRHRKQPQSLEATVNNRDSDYYSEWIPPQVEHETVIETTTESLSRYPQRNRYPPDRLTY